MSTARRSPAALPHVLPPNGKEALTAPYRRHELKFALPKAAEDDVRSLIDPYVQWDEHCAGPDAPFYTVRSIYYDTDDLRFYREKLDSVKVRRKLRVRTYDRPGERSIAFLEIKRKIGKRGLKQRVALQMNQLEPALNGKSPQESLPDGSWAQRRILDQFRFNVKAVQLQPVVLVCYEREAFVAPGDVHVRVTFDRGMRSLWRPELRQLTEDRDLVRFAEDHWVLELKFDDRMPRWMGRLISHLDLRRESYSKYCHGIEAAAPAEVLQHG